MKNEEVLRRVKMARNIIHTVKIRKANWIGHILRRNGLRKHVTGEKIEGGIEITGRQGRRRKHLLGNLNKTRGYWKVKKKPIDRTVQETALEAAMEVM